MKPQTSNLVTRAGLIALALLALGAFYLRIGTLEILFSAVLLLCLAAYFWARSALRGIRVEVSGEDCRAFPGEMLEARARLKNAKFLPVVWLEASFPTRGAGCVAPPEDETGDGEPRLGESFLWVMPQQTICWTQRARAVKRGVCRAGTLELCSGDGFGLTEQRCQAPLPAPFRFVVYPRLIPVDAAPVMRSMSEMERYNRGIYTDQTLLRSTRAYRDGDSARDINWRLLARQDELQVNIREKLAMRRVCLMPDLASFGWDEVTETNGERYVDHHVYEDDLERMLSVVGSLVAALTERDVICSLVIPACGGEAARIAIPEARETQVVQMLTELAQIEYAGGPAAFPAEEMPAQLHRLGQLFLFSRGPGGAQFPESLGLPAVIRVLQEAGDGEGRNIIRETELTAV